MDTITRYPTDFLYSIDNGKTFFPITVWSQEVADDFVLLEPEEIEHAEFYEDLGLDILFGFPEYPHHRVAYGYSFHKLNEKAKRLIQKLTSKRGIRATIHSPFGTAHQVHLSGEFTALDTDVPEFVPTAVCNDFE